MAAGPELHGKAVTRAVFISAAASVLVADLVTKWLAFRCLDLFSPHVVISGFLNLRLSENLGAVFGIGQGKGWVFILFTAVAVPVIVWAAVRYGRTSRLFTFGLGCILGGALGNLWDRLMLGHVRDFIDMYVGQRHWPTFNVADMAICVGAAILVIHSYRAPEARRQASAGRK